MDPAIFVLGKLFCCPCWGFSLLRILFDRSFENLLWTIFVLSGRLLPFVRLLLSGLNIWIYNMILSFWGLCSTGTIAAHAFSTATLHSPPQRMYFPRSLKWPSFSVHIPSIPPHSEVVLAPLASERSQISGSNFVISVGYKLESAPSSILIPQSASFTLKRGKFVGPLHVNFQCKEWCSHLQIVLRNIAPWRMNFTRNYILWWLSQQFSTWIRPLWSWWMRSWSLKLPWIRRRPSFKRPSLW